jgi:3'-5' exonuclease
VECIPSQLPGIREEIAETVTPPASISKAETLAAWEKDKKPALIEEAYRKTALDGTLGQIVCIGFAFDGGGVGSIDDSDGDEAFVIRTFFDLCERMFDSSDQRRPCFIGHNIVGFDLRYIWQRAVINGVKVPAWFPYKAKPWDDSVFDTMTEWAGVGKFIGMSKLCKVFGIDGKPDDIDGSTVWDHYQAGNIEKISEYCRGDVERTREIYRRMTGVSI